MVGFISPNKDEDEIEVRFGGSGLSFIPASDSAPFGWGPGDPTAPEWVDPLGIPNTEPNTAVLSGKWVSPNYRRRVDVRDHDPYNNHGRVTLEPESQYGGGFAIVSQYESYGTPSKSILYRKGKAIGRTRDGEFVTSMEFVRENDTVYLWVLTTDSWRTKLWSYLFAYNKNTNIEDSQWVPIGSYDTAALTSVSGSRPAGGGGWVSYTMKRRLAVPTVNGLKNKVCVSFYAVPDQYVKWVAANLVDGGDPAGWRFKNIVGLTQEDPQALLYYRIHQQAYWGGYLVFDDRFLSSPTVHWHPTLSLPNTATSYNFNVVFDAYFNGEDVYECTANVVASLGGKFIDEETGNPAVRPSTFPTTESWVWHYHAVSGGTVQHVEITYNFGFATLRSFFSRAAVGASASNRLRYKNWSTFSGNAIDDVVDDGETALYSITADSVELITEHRIYYYNLKKKVIAHGRHDWVGTRNYSSTNVHTYAIYTSDMFVTTDKITRKVTNKMGYDWHARVDDSPIRTEGSGPWNDVLAWFGLTSLPLPYVYREPILERDFSVFFYEHERYGAHIQQWFNYDRYKGEIGLSVEETFGGRAYGSYADLPSFQKFYSYLTPPYLAPFFGHNWRYQYSFPGLKILELTKVVGDYPRFHGICLY